MLALSEKCLKFSIVKKGEIGKNRRTFDFDSEGIMLRYLCYILVFCAGICEAKQPELTPDLLKEKVNEILKEHATYKMLNQEIMRRTLQNYLEELDPTKSYFIQEDIDQWLNPSDVLIEKILQDYNNGKFDTFKQINEVMVRAIARRRALEHQIDYNALPKNVSPKEFKDMKWVHNDDELLLRLKRLRSLQLETSEKLNEEQKDRALKRMQKRQMKYEEGFLTSDPVMRERLMLSDVLKATASALDAHTAYLTPDEASQFMINVMQRLSGIGAQLRDDLNGFTIIKIIEGSPAALSKDIKVKDRIIAVDGEPVVGMDIVDAVDLIRGVEGTPVTLTIIRETKEGDVTKEEKKDVVIKRSAVVLKEARYESSYEPFGDSGIAYLKLYTFYQDPDTSSAADLANELKNIQKDHKVDGVILDLRYNSGGLLSQAVDVAGLFITKGTVVSVKDETGAIQHLRHLDGKPVWGGPLLVLVNRSSASAAEIVAQSLQDYGRAILVGDDHTYGKGSYQTFTLNASKGVNPQGEYKVTRGRYYTVSGKTPQLTGVFSDIIVPGILSESDIGEKFGKFPLENDQIKPNFDDDLQDIPFTQREKIRLLYKFNLQPKVETYVPFLPKLKENSKERLTNNKDYKKFLKELKQHEEVEETEEQVGKQDLQLSETFNIMKDLLLLMYMQERDKGTQKDKGT